MRDITIVEGHPAGTERLEATHDIDECCFAAPVGADQSQDLPARQLQAGLVDCAQSVKVDRDLVDPQVACALAGLGFHDWL